MEIEAKFRIPDAALARKLRALERVGACTLDAGQRVVVRDTFFDTVALELRGVRYVLRVRKQSHRKLLLTLKTPAVPTPHLAAAIHHRPEIESELDLARTPRRLRVNELPARVRSLVAPNVRAETLHALFSIAQTRHVRMLRRGRRVIAEWSLDRVQFRAGERAREFYELEIELKRAGTVQDLTEISDWLRGEMHLEPEREGKFVRAVQFMRGSA